jgi:hypothetical protein
MNVRRRWGRRSLKSRLGVTGMVGVTALAAIGAVLVLMELRGGGGEEAALVEYLRSTGQSPVELITAAAENRRFIFVADIHPSPEPKRLAAEVARALASGPGLDAVAVEIDADFQPLLDQYIATTPENTSILMAAPRSTREHRGGGASLLPLYRAIWQLNAELPAARSIRIIAVDRPEWAGRGPLRPRELAGVYASRAEYMVERLEEEVLRLHPGARVLAFVDGYQVLRAGGGEFQAGGSGIMRAGWFAAELDARYPRDVFSVLTDGGSLQPAPEEIAYRGTAFGSVVRGQGVRGPRAVAVGAAFDFMRQPIDTRTGPGLDLDITPRGFRLRDVAHAYVYLGS